MDLFAHINGTDYPIVPGCVLADNMGEELDSMQISIPHTEKIEVKPFDDVYIHDGWYNGRTRASLVVPNGFYRHFDAYNTDCNEVNQIDGMYNYQMQLVSETKYLEKVLMPNRTITIPLNKKGKSVYEMSRIFVDRYSPKIKIKDVDDATWEWANRFVVSRSSMFQTQDERDELERSELLVVEEVFSDIQAPETSFNNPTLREVLTKIFSVGNCIPVVRDGIIFARDISKRNRRLSHIPGLVWNSFSMSGDQYCDRLRKNYQSGLTDKNGVVFHEYVGFRNFSVPSMRYSDLQIELKHPIYKINKLLVCFYAKPDGKVVKLDISKFVIPSTTRAFLSNDYLTFQKSKPKTINGYESVDNVYVLGLCDYKFMTIQYAIGSNVISGFGEMIKYTTNGIDYVQRSVFENILAAVIDIEFGSAAFEKGLIPTSASQPHWTQVPVHEEGKYALNEIMAEIPPQSPNSFWDNLITKIFSKDGENGGEGILSSDSLRMKSVFFEVEYQGIISSSVYVSKDLHDGDIMAIDNQQESLAVMEQDGITSKFKANRLGNEISSKTARVSSMDDLANIGDYYVDSNDRKWVCQKRTIGLERDFISAHYIFAQDFVLTNYFTGVFSKYRSSAYFSASQSVERNEIANVQFLMSKQKRMRNPQSGMHFSYDVDLESIFRILGNRTHGLTKPIAYFSVVAPKQSSYAYDEYSADDLELQYFSLDRANYMSGVSFCCTFGMQDSETSGTYIRQLFPDVTNSVMDAFTFSASNFDENGVGPYMTYAMKDSPINDLTGSAQDFLSLPTSRSDGKVEDMEFCLKIAGSDLLDSIYEANEAKTEDEAIDLYHERLLKLPRLNKSGEDPIVSQLDNAKGITIREGYKDAKEVINETFQIEPISDTSSISFSPYLLKFSEFSSDKRKISFTETITANTNEVLCFTDNMVYFMKPYLGSLAIVEYCGVFIHSLGLYTAEGDFNLSRLAERVGEDINAEFVCKCVSVDDSGSGDYEIVGTEEANPYKYAGSLFVNVKKIKSVSNENIVVTMSMTFSFGGNGWTAPSPSKTNQLLEGCVSIDTGDFDAVWWDSNLINAIDGQNVNNDSLNNGFYPRYDPTGDSNYYTYYTTLNQTQTSYPYKKVDTCFLPSAQNRRCFSFCFASFPANEDIKLTLTYANNTKRTIDTGDEFIPGIPVNPPSDKKDLYNILPIVGMSYGQTYFRNRWDELFGYTFDIPLPKYKKGNILIEPPDGPDYCQYDKPFSAHETIVTEPNSFWYLSQNKVSSIFNPNVSYSKDRMASLGFREALPMSGSQDFGVIDGNEIRLSMRPKPSPIHAPENYKSANMFYLDSDGMLHFVFGCDGEYDDQANEFSSSFYASLLYDRSKTVFDVNMEPTYEVKQDYGNNDSEDDICVAKNG